MITFHKVQNRTLVFFERVVDEGEEEGTRASGGWQRPVRLTHTHL